ncbi:MAG: hypothetical protein Sylvanvirus1_92 [Sylvanvirus sp.]|uniref:Uncharacterized protein n=1 Tax=Sylvanvirus sp. TaxID=2487774 RepID=A0A3G5AH00_9VIRU|nr:MAG: hypothetical protein Sylvanvirus1_92 [Sylvanvirus sp.]
MLLMEVREFHKASKRRLPTLSLTTLFDDHSKKIKESKENL